MTKAAAVLLVMSGCHAEHATPTVSLASVPTSAATTPTSHAVDAGEPRVTYFNGEDEREFPAVAVETVKVFEGRPWIPSKRGTLVFSVEDGRAPMPAPWIDRLRREAAARGCGGIQIGFRQGAMCDYFVTPERIDGYCARCLETEK